MPKNTSSTSDSGAEENERSSARPSATPPKSVAAASGSSGEGQPSETPPSEGSKSSSSSGETAPSFTPPSAGTGDGGITAWQNDKRITGLWSISENRNAWVYITGVGWKKLFNGDDSANTALNMISGSARQTNTQVNYREEADGMIHEMYVW